MVNLSWVGDVIRFPFVLLRKAVLLVLTNIVPLIIITLFFLFFYWFFSSGVRGRLVNYFIKRREERYAIRRSKH